MNSPTDPFYVRMTNAQKAVMNEHVASIESELLKALASARKAYDAIEHLPATNENGTDVVHGCNVRMSKIVDLHMQVANAWYMRMRMVDDNKATEIYMANKDLWKF